MDFVVHGVTKSHTRLNDLHVEGRTQEEEDQVRKLLEGKG